MDDFLFISSSNIYLFILCEHHYASATCSRTCYPDHYSSPFTACAVQYPISRDIYIKIGALDIVSCARCPGQVLMRAQVKQIARRHRCTPLPFALNPLNQRSLPPHTDRCIVTRRLSTVGALMVMILIKSIIGPDSGPKCINYLQ